MFRLSRVLLQKNAVRPRTPNLNASSASPRTPKGPRITPIGLAFILGGLAFASYIFKPSRRVPTAAMDNFKPQIAIVFGLGDSNSSFEKAASELGFNYIDVGHDLDKMDQLVKSGITRFFLGGFKNSEDLHHLCETVVQPDLIFEFGDSGSNDISAAPRVVKLNKSCDPTEICKVLEKRNLA